MITDYFLKDSIITTYTDWYKSIFKVEIYDRAKKTTYRITDKKTIDRIMEELK